MIDIKLVLLADTHIPYHIRLEPVFEFIKDFKPDKIILVGDMHDWTAVSHWIADQSRNLDGGIIQENYAELHKILLNPLKKIKNNAESNSMFLFFKSLVNSGNFTSSFSLIVVGGSFPNK